MQTTVAISQEDFSRCVIDESHQRPVLVDCWAAWCGPCQQLKPVLEKLAEKLDGHLLLATIDTEAEPDLARQLQVSSIPDVRLYHHGKEVDRFLGFRPLDLIMEFVGPHLPSPADEIVQKAEQALAEGHSLQAEELSERAVKTDKTNIRAWKARIRIAVIRADIIAARVSLSHLRQLPGGAKAAEALEPMVQATEERFELANVDHDSIDGLYGKGLSSMVKEDWETALDCFLELVQRDRQYRSGKAHQHMLHIFLLLGKGHPLAERFRSKLAVALY
jgi:putative thioredoxin